MWSTGRPDSSAAGFTLIELLVVMAIMTLALALVPPLLSSGRASQSLKIDLRQIASGIEFARARAIMLNRPVMLAIDLHRRQVALESEDKIWRLHDTTDLDLAIAEDAWQGSGIGTFLFYPEGGSSGGTVTLSSGPARYRLSIDWLTGNVRTDKE